MKNLILCVPLCAFAVNVFLQSLVYLQNPVYI
jgi:hypothetical protein